MPATKSKHDHQYPDDIFADTRMSFGEHIDELRTRLIRALMGLFFCMVIGFILDGIGSSVGNKNIGIGRPMIDVITEPVISQVKKFYQNRNDKAFSEKLKTVSTSAIPPERIQEIREKYFDKDGKWNGDLTGLSDSEREALLGKPEQMLAVLPAALFGKPKEDAKDVAVAIQVYPAVMTYLSNKGEAALGSKNYLSTLSVQEGFVMYFKVTLICGVVISSPWLLFQFWMFVGAGLYPHEKKLIGLFFWPSLLLFIGGVLLCQFVVLPGAVSALLKFNEFLGFDPEIRVREWIGLALVLPLVFGISFQTPLVMIFLNRIGMFSAQDYLTKWRLACMVMAVFAALLTPTPDVVTMMYMFVPMFGLYLVGILFCHLFPGFEDTPDDIPADEVAV
ncbi:MAG TPA: twin-arginine translocase subunit TatC [Gemmataceae bacterium]|nr:twin-arginine translocase subunit TatC [Gemmataceae bacterium]